MPAAYLYLHGLQSSPQAQKAGEIAEFLKTRGQTLLCPDLRAPYGMVHGLQHAFEIAVAAMDAEEARVQNKLRWRIVGSSYGGYLTALLASRLPERIERCLLLAPAFEMQKLWDAQLGSKGLAAWQQAGVLPVDNPDKSKSLLPYSFYQEIAQSEPHPLSKVATAILHGSNDTTVPPELSAKWSALQEQTPLRFLVPDEHRLAHSTAPMLWLVDRWLCAEQLPDESVLRDGKLAHWDHLGRTGIETAKHFRAHLLEFLVSRELTHLATGLDSLHPSHGEAWCVGASDEMQVVIEALRPRRLESCFAEPSAAPPPN